MSSGHAKKERRRAAAERESDVFISPAALPLLEFVSTRTGRTLSELGALLVRGLLEREIAQERAGQARAESIRRLEELVTYASPQTGPAIPK
jgi:hypothetical protein